MSWVRYPGLAQDRREHTQPWQQQERIRARTAKASRHPTLRACTAQSHTYLGCIGSGHDDVAALWWIPLTDTLQGLGICHVHSSGCHLDHQVAKQVA